MKPSVAASDIEFKSVQLTQHAQQRMGMRGISSTNVNKVLTYGRKAHIRGAVIFAVGRREIALCDEYGVDLSELEGLQVVCSNDGAVMTVYRNRDFRGLRPQRRRMH